MILALCVIGFSGCAPELSSLDSHAPAEATGAAIGHQHTASFSGTWVGRGTYIHSGDLTSCMSFQMEFRTDRETFEFRRGFRVCEKHREEFAPVRMTIRGGNLYYGAQKVGTIDGNLITASFSMQEGPGRVRQWRMSMRREGEHLMYEESRTMQGELTPLISFAGLLMRPPP